MTCLVRMSFLPQYIKWVFLLFGFLGFRHACILLRFPFLLIGNQAVMRKKIQEKIPLSMPLFDISVTPLSFLFILTSENLIAILNKAMGMDMIPRLDQRQNLNFNCLMYANDLILVSKATRKIDRNCNLYLSIYSKLTGQHPNYSKSVVLFPSWVSKWFVKSIFSILNFRIGSFPFTYVGVMITPKRIKISPIKPMVSHISNITNVWNHSNFSKA